MKTNSVYDENDGEALGVEERAAAGQVAWLDGIFRKEDFEGIEWRGAAE